MSKLLSWKKNLERKPYLGSGFSETDLTPSIKLCLQDLNLEIINMSSYKQVTSCIDRSITHLDSSIRMLLIGHQDITKSICQDQFPGENFPR